MYLRERSSRNLFQTESENRLDEARLPYRADANRFSSNDVKGCSVFNNQSRGYDPSFRGENEPGSPARTPFFRLVGIICRDDDQPTAFCALTWQGPASFPTRIRMFVARNWMDLLPAKDLGYVTDVLCDWKQLLLGSPATLLALTGELSVGPVRTMQESNMDWESAFKVINQHLKEPYCYTSLH